MLCMSQALRGVSLWVWNFTNIGLHHVRWMTNLCTQCCTLLLLYKPTGTMRNKNWRESVSQGLCMHTTIISREGRRHGQPIGADIPSNESKTTVLWRDRMQPTQIAGRPILYFLPHTNSKSASKTKRRAKRATISSSWIICSELHQPTGRFTRFHPWKRWYRYEDPGREIQTECWFYNQPFTLKDGNLVQWVGETPEETKVASIKGESSSSLEESVLIILFSPVH